MIGLITLRAS